MMTYKHEIKYSNSDGEHKLYYVGVKEKLEKQDIDSLMEKAKKMHQSLNQPFHIKFVSSELIRDEEV